MKLMLDFDITMGVPQRDVDDGLALLYVLGNPELELLGATTTFGNATLDIVHKTALDVWKDLGLAGRVPLHRGAASPRHRRSEAAEALAAAADAHPGTLTVLGLGSVTNLMGAAEIDPDFFLKVGRIVLMGGLIKPLIINGKEMRELNFSADPLAAHTVLNSPAPVTVITGHLCLQALFTPALYDTMNQGEGPAVFRYIRRMTEPWLKHIGGSYSIGGFHNWDATAALYLDSPELFEAGSLTFSATVQELRSGMLVGSAPPGRTLSVPTRILDEAAFNRRLIDTWGRVILPEGPNP